MLCILYHITWHNNISYQYIVLLFLFLQYQRDHPPRAVSSLFCCRVPKGENRNSVVDFALRIPAIKTPNLLQPKSLSLFLPLSDRLDQPASFAVSSFQQLCSLSTIAVHCCRPFFEHPFWFVTSPLSSPHFGHPTIKTHPQPPLHTPSPLVFDSGTQQHTCTFL